MLAEIKTIDFGYTLVVFDNNIRLKCPTYLCRNDSEKHAKRLVKHLENSLKVDMCRIADAEIKQRPGFHFVTIVEQSYTGGLTLALIEAISEKDAKKKTNHVWAYRNDIIHAINGIQP